jgi:hypothetical protein
MSVERLGLIVCGLCLGTGAMAAEEPPPDAEFLEYLGMWEQTDEEWVLQDGILTAENEQRSDPATKEEESPENEDES